jgi:hypothetical protein
MIYIYSMVEKMYQARMPALKDKGIEEKNEFSQPQIVSCPFNSVLFYCLKFGLR